MTQYYEVIDASKELPGKKDTFFTYFEDEKYPQSLGAHLFQPLVKLFEMEDDYEAQPTHWLRPLPEGSVVVSGEECNKPTEEEIFEIIINHDMSYSERASYVYNLISRKII